MRGVGPADSTGKSLVRYWPGGSWRPLSRLRPLKPLVTMPIDALLQRSRLNLNARASTSCGPRPHVALDLMWHCATGCGSGRPEIASSLAQFQTQNCGQMPPLNRFSQSFAAVPERQAGDVTANSYDDPVPISAREFGSYGRGYLTEVAKLVAGGRLIEKEMPWK